MPIASSCHARSRRAAPPPRPRPAPTIGTQPAAATSQTRLVGAPRISADTTATTAIATMSQAWIAHARSAPSAVAIERDPGGPVSLDVDEGVGDREGGSRGDGDRDEEREHGRQGAGRTEPAEDRQDRDPDGERQPRPGRSLEAEVVGKADPDDRRRPARPSRDPDGIDRTSPVPKRDDGHGPAIGGATSPPGIGLPGLCPASRGASTRSFVAPIPNWSVVIATPSRSASAGAAPARIATAPVTMPSRTDGNG